MTWEREDGRLRGCIGTLAPTHLRNLRAFAFKSALKDRRFAPIAPAEVATLHCSVSLLVDYEEAERFDDWEVRPQPQALLVGADSRLTSGRGQIGVHGIIVEFRDGAGSFYSATYLPQVASEQGWDHLETVTSLMRKAGFRRSVTSDMLHALKVTRYRSSIHKLSFREYMAIKERGLDFA